MAALGSGPVAIFPWGDVIEDFLDPLGLSIEDYVGRMSGGWLFGYVAALQRQGLEAIIVYASERIDRPTCFTHHQTGARIWLAPGRRSGGGCTGGRPSARALAQWVRTPWRAFSRILQREGCTALLVQDYEHARFDALWVLGRSLGLPVWATFQGGDLTLSPLEARARRRTLSGCDGLIVPSGRERERLAKVYRVPEAKLRDIPNPVDGDVWRALPRAEARAGLQAPPEEFIVVNHGRIDIQRKGLDVLLQAWSSVTPHLPRARLVVIGSGQDHQDFADRVAAAANVTWVSQYLTDGLTIRRWLSAADVYVTLSRTEGMPVAPLEAMACGLPVIASDTHGLADIFRQGEGAGGIVVPREDAPAAAQALRRLAADAPLRSRLGQAARRTIETTYSLDAVGAALKNALETELGGAPVRHAHA
jgi:glycosyltransferase involved in cell wall biosynthesis